MKTILSRLRGIASALCIALVLLAPSAGWAQALVEKIAPGEKIRGDGGAETGNQGQSTAPIPFSEIGAKATADYKGDAIGITATTEGARLHTEFQKLSGSVAGADTLVTLAQTPRQ